MHPPRWHVCLGCSWRLCWRSSGLLLAWRPRLTPRCRLRGALHSLRLLHLRMLLLHSLLLSRLPLPLAVGRFLRPLARLNHSNGLLDSAGTHFRCRLFLCRMVGACSLLPSCCKCCRIARGGPHGALPLLLVGRLGGAFAAQAGHIVLRHPLLAAAAAATACHPQGRTRAGGGGAALQQWWQLGVGSCGRCVLLPELLLGPCSLLLRLLLLLWWCTACRLPLTPLLL